MAINGLTQIRYYSDNDPRNTPFPTKESYSKTFDFSIYAKIRYMMVYALPGTKFYINTGVEETNKQGIIVGDTGLYTIDFRERSSDKDPNDTSIKSFSVDPKSLEIIHSNPEGYLVVILAHETMPVK